MKRSSNGKEKPTLKRTDTLLIDSDDETKCQKGLTCRCQGGIQEVQDRIKKVEERLEFLSRVLEDILEDRDIMDDSDPEADSQEEEEDW